MARGTVLKALIAAVYRRLPNLTWWDSEPFHSRRNLIVSRNMPRLPAHTVFPVGQIFSFASRKFQYLHRVSLLSGTKCNLQIYGRARASFRFTQFSFDILIALPKNMRHGSRPRFLNSK